MEEENKNYINRENEINILEKEVEILESNLEITNEQKKIEEKKFNEKEEKTIEDYSLIINKEIFLNLLEKSKDFCKKSKYFEEKPNLIDHYCSKDHLKNLLRSTDNNLNKSFEMWKKWLEWRIKYGVDEIKVKEIEIELRTGKAFYHKKDKFNNPVLIVKPKFHNPYESSTESMIKLGIFLIERGFEMAKKEKSEKIAIIYDREGFGYKNLDKRFIEVIKNLLSFIQENYNDRIMKIYVLHANFIFRSFYKIIKPFLTEKSKEKITIISDIEELKEYFDSESLMIEHGGTSNYNFEFSAEYEKN